MLITALGGGNLIHDVGYIESGMTASYDQIAAMDEMAGMVKRFMEGIDLNADEVALDVIDQVGPGGHFLAEEHTYQHFRRNWLPTLLDRSSREKWENEGEKTLGDRANARVRDLIENHPVPSLDEDVKRELADIVQDAEERVSA